MVRVLLKDAVEVLDQRRGGDQQLRGHRGHNRRQHGGEHDTCDQRVEHDASQVEEDRFKAGLVGHRCGLLAEVGGAHQGGDCCTGEADEYPDAARTASGLCLCRGAQRHEAGDNVRLAEVAKAPRQVADNRCCGDTSDHVEEVGVTVLPRTVRLGGRPREDVGRAIECKQREHRHNQQSQEHQGALHGIGVAHSQEATDEGVQHGDRTDDQHTGQVVTVEGGLVVTATGDHAGGDVEREENDDDHGGSETQRARLVVRAVFEEARQRDRVVGHFRVGAHAGCDPLPVRPRAKEEADGDPELTEAGDEQRAGQAHQQPAGHVRSTGRKRRDERVEATVA